MEPETNRKIQIKVLREEYPDRDPEWMHVCYINSEIYDAFFDATCIERVDFSDFLTKWCKDDFNLDLTFTKANDIRILKELVVDRYQSIYPHVHYNKAVDRHGWMRVWVSEHMGKELKKHAKPVYNRLFRSAKDNCY